MTYSSVSFYISKANQDYIDDVIENKPRYNKSNLVDDMLTAAREKYEKKNGKPQKKESIPYDDIYKLYKEVCTNLKQPQLLTQTRKNLIKTFFAHHESKRSMAEVRKYLEACNNAPFLTGKNDRGWVADFDKIFNKDTIIKLAEGKYH